MSLTLDQLNAGRRYIGGAVFTIFIVLGIASCEVTGITLKSRAPLSENKQEMFAGLTEEEKEEKTEIMRFLEQRQRQRRRRQRQPRGVLNSKEELFKSLFPKPENSKEEEFLFPKPEKPEGENSKEEHGQNEGGQDELGQDLEGGQDEHGQNEGGQDLLKFGEFSFNSDDDVIVLKNNVNPSDRVSISVLSVHGQDNNKEKKPPSVEDKHFSIELVHGQDNNKEKSIELVHGQDNNKEKSAASPSVEDKHFSIELVASNDREKNSHEQESYAYSSREKNAEYSSYSSAEYSAREKNASYSSAEYSAREKNSSREKNREKNSSEHSSSYCSCA